MKFQNLFRLFLVSMALMPSISNAQNWANIATVGTLNNNELCYTDGTDIICDAGLFVNGTAALEVSGTVSATAFVGDGSQLTGVTASSVTLAINDLTDGKYDGSSLFVGAGAGAVDDGSANNNVGVGRNALSLNTTGYNNSAFGRETLFKNETGINNTALGSQVLYENLSGSNNVGIGLNAMLKNSTGSRNIAIGRQALNYNTSGHSNVAVGAQASFGSLGLSTGSYNISIGEAANIALQSGNNNIAIGASTSVPSATGNNQLNIGNTIYGNLGTNHVAIGKYVDSNYELDVSGTIHADVVSATTFVGDGSGLTGLAASLAELTDVSSSMAPSANQLLGYNGSTSEWEPVDPSAAGLWTDAGDYITRDGFRVYVSGTTIDLNNGEYVAFWDQEKGAFRAGQAGSSNWDEANIGLKSIVLGSGSATSEGAVAIGINANATNTNAIALGKNASASGDGALALNGVASARWAVAIKGAATAQNAISIANYGGATGGRSVAIGSAGALNSGAQARAMDSVALGIATDTWATASRSNAIGYGSEVSGTRSTSIGYGMWVTGSDSFGIGVGSEASDIELADNKTLAIMGASGGVGIGTVSPNAELEVSGTVSATAFVGDGSQLTGVTASSVTLAINDLTDAAYDGSSLFVGAGAGAVDDGSANNNVGVGRDALSLNTTGYNNSAFGRETLFKNETGINNTALGSQVLYENLSGSNNVGIGLNAMISNRTGSRNIAIGLQALNYNTSGHSNVALGSQASFGSLGLSTGSYNVSIGESANVSLQSGNNNIAIGASTSVPSATGNNQLNIGNTIYGNLGTKHVAIGKYVDSNYELDVSGTIHADVVSATTFVGDGSGLTNLAAGSNIAAGDTSVSIVDGGTGEVYLDVDGENLLTAKQGALSVSGNVGIGTQTPVGELNVIAIDTIGMNPNAGNPSSENAAINISDGTLEMLLDSNEIFQREDNLNLGAMGRNDERGDIIFMTGNTSNSFEPRVAIRADGTVDVTGTVSATAFVGDGSGLTNLPFDASSIAAGDTSVSVVDGGTGEIHLDADGVRTVTVAEGSVDISASAKIAGTGSEVCGASSDLGRMRWNPVTQKFQICRQ